MTTAFASATLAELTALESVDKTGMTAGEKRSLTCKIRNLRKQVSSSAPVDKAQDKTAPVQEPVQEQQESASDTPKWHAYPVSKRQKARVHACEKALGLKLSDKSVFADMNAGQASALYQSLKADMTEQGITF